MKKINTLLIILFSLLLSNIYAQFSVTANNIADSLVRNLIGPGVTLDTAWINCPNGASGFFSNAPTGLGFTDGVVLSTGNVINIPNNQAVNASTNHSASGDADLTALFNAVGSSTTSTNDACALEFDIVVTGDSLRFGYSFGSEEYNEYVCNTYNDIFAFFLSGPNPAGGSYTNHNVALVPGTTTPVTVNTINNGTSTGSNPFCNTSNAQYFQNGGINGIVYDGITQAANDNTRSLQAIAATVPCQTYHFKLVIADGQDYAFDSGVFLEEGSFTSNAVVVGSSTVLGEGFNDAVEGCVDAQFVLEIDTAYSIPVMLGYQISGTATNGVDYNFIPDSVLMPAGDTSIIIPVNVIADNIVEGTETVILTPYTECGTLGTPASLNILDFDSFQRTINASDTVLCEPAIVTLTATGSQFYNWQDSTLINQHDSAIAITADSLRETTTFYMNGTLGTCSYTDSITIQVSQTNPTFHIEDISCAGANDGQYWVELNDSANVPITYNYPFTAGHTDSILTNIAPGFQIVNITDALGCVFSGSLHNFTNPTASTFSYDSIPISCPGANDGQICIYNIANGNYTAYITLNGTLSDSAYFIMSNDTFCITNLSVGTYDIQFIDTATTCGNTFTTTLNNPSATVFAYDSTNVSCNGLANGTIDLFNLTNGNYTATATHNGTTTNHSFVISNDTFSLNNLDTGLHSITFTNTTTNCGGTFEVNIQQPDSLQTNIAVMGSALCSGGNADSLVSSTLGGTAPYTYLWNTSATTANIQNIPFNTYHIVVTDALNCTTSDTITLTPPQALYLNIAQDSVTCFGGNNGMAYIDSISGGNAPYSYAWSSGVSTDTAQNLSIGQIILTLTDANNCSIADTTNVLQPTDSVNISLSTHLITCFGGDTCIEATISGGNAPYTYLWNDPSAQTTEDICGLPTGTYTLTATDQHNCTATESITINEVPQINLSIDSTHITCYGLNNGTATVTATGGSGSFTYQWNDPAMQTTATASNLAVGAYTVVVKDVNDVLCSQSISVNIEQPADSLSVALNNIVDVNCYGSNTGSININANGGTTPYTYAWSNGSSNQNLSNVLAGNYTLTVTDANNCQQTFTGNVSQPDSLQIVLTNQNNVSCFGGNNGAIDIQIVGGVAPYTYAWNNGESTEDINNLTANNYTISITDANNCSATRTFSIGQPEGVNISFTYSNYNGNNISCHNANDGTIEAHITGGTAPFTYLWSNGTSNQLNANLNNTEQYSIVVTDAVGCSYTDTANRLTQPDSLSVDTSHTNLSCADYNDGTATAIATGGTTPYNYQWNDSQAQNTATANHLAVGTYQCIVTDANACSQTVQVTIATPPPIVLTATIDSVKCWGDASGSITLHAQGGNGQSFDYSIDGGTSYQADSIFDNLSAGVYDQLMVRQGGINGCLSALLGATVRQPEPMVVSINPNDTTIQLNEIVPVQLVVDSSTGYYANTSYTLNDISSISWSPTDGLSCVDCANPQITTYAETEYTATIYYSEYNCVTTAEMTIDVENNLKLFIPSAFSPQNDGANDVHYVFGEGIKTFYFAVYNRIGEKIFESNNQAQGWDGSYKGIAQQPGVYTYYFKATYLDNKTISKKGTITLLR